MGAPTIGCDHLLVGLAQLKRGVAAHTLGEVGADLGHLERSLGSG